VEQRRLLHCWIRILILISLFPAATHSQSFTRVRTGPIVTDSDVTWGCAFGDFNNDGFPDLFVGNNGINALFQGTGDTIFVMTTAEPFLSDAGNSRGGTWGDYDNDGDLDLFVPNNGTDNFLYRNDGPPSGYGFTKILDDTVANDGTDSRGSSWVDYDNDGFLDLFIARNGNNYLYRNNGNGSFARIDTGALANDGRFSIGPSWCDYDNDGDADLFVANMNFAGNLLYRNNGNGWFTRDTSVVGTDAGSSAAGTWADFDNDGDMDLFVANAPGTNFLYANNGPPGYDFTKITDGPIATDGGTSYGSVWADFDNDGDLDLFVANVGTNFYYENNGPPDFTFTKLTGINLATDAGSSYGSCVADIDNDGDLDIFVGNTSANFLYVNDGGTNSWSSVHCVGTLSNTSAIGARVRTLAVIFGQPVWQVRDVAGQTCYYSQSGQNVSFGFGDASAIDSVIIEWPSGTIDRHGPVEVGHFLTAVEGGEIVTDVRTGGPELPSVVSLTQNYPNPFNPSTAIEFYIGKRQGLTLKIYDLLGREVTTLFEGVSEPGVHRFSWSPSHLASGVYFYILRTEQGTLARKMTFLR